MTKIEAINKMIYVGQKNCPLDKQRLHGAAYIHVSSAVSASNDWEPGYLLRTDTSADNLRQSGGRDAPKAAEIHPLFHGICSRHCSAEQQTLQFNIPRCQKLNLH